MPLIAAVVVVIAVIAVIAVTGAGSRAGHPGHATSGASGPSQARRNAAFQQGYSFAESHYALAYQAIVVGYSRDDAAYCAWSLTAGWAGPYGNGGPLSRSYLKGCVRGLIASGVVVHSP